MKATISEMNELSQALWKRGVAGFCATTLSAPHRDLVSTVTQLGKWIRSNEAPGAIPLGIHLEGPYVHPGACGAHPPGSIRKLNWDELDELWERSQKTLKILTVAPEILSSTELKNLTKWAREKKVILSLGHSMATEKQAAAAFDAGFSGVTHAWNALPFHHRAPGPLGAALGRKNLHVELILDQIHVAPSAIRWTLQLHPKGTCFVSDCVPAAATPQGSWHSFGSLKIQVKSGACRLSNGELAGGGVLLPDAYIRWIEDETARGHGVSTEKLWKETVACLTTYPLKALRISPRVLAHRRVFWQISPQGKLKLIPRPQKS